MRNIEPMDINSRDRSMGEKETLTPRPGHFIDISTETSRSKRINDEEDYKYFARCRFSLEYSVETQLNLLALRSNYQELFVCSLVG